jgi:fumigallin biosynthesis monooxygenase-like protein
LIIIGMRVNKPWKLHKWVPVFLAMPRMLKELKQQPESGFLGSISGGLIPASGRKEFARGRVGKDPSRTRNDPACRLPVPVFQISG